MDQPTADGLRPTSRGPDALGLGRLGLLGNELADSLAKESCRLPPCLTTVTVTQVAAAKLAEGRYNTALQPYWNRCAPARCRQLQIPVEVGIP